MQVDGDGDLLVSVDRLSEMSLSGQLIIDPASMRALHIFQVCRNLENDCDCAP